MGITYLSRDEWGADTSLRRRGRRVDGRRAFRGVFVHHTVFRVSDWDSDGISTGDLDDIKEFMRRLQVIRPDLGYDVPYSFVVFAGKRPQDSIVCEGRGLDYTGAHTAGFNSTRLGVSIAGNTSEEPVTPGILNGIRWCGALLLDQGDLKDTLPHQAVKATACPGSSMMAALHQVQPPFTPPPESEEEEDTDMITVIDTRDGKGWVCADGKARPLSNPDSWLQTWDGPVRKAAYMGNVVNDLYEVI